MIGDEMSYGLVRASAKPRTGWGVKLIASLSLALYVLSFLLPAFKIVVDGRSEISYGYEAFVVSILYSFSPDGFTAFVPWVANPMLWVGSILFMRTRFASACVAGMGACAMAATLLLRDAESRHLLLMGYYVWVLSMVLFTVAGAIQVVWDGAEEKTAMTEAGNP
jgi:hypothetical protein